jgi:hypothetical protein
VNRLIPQVEFALDEIHRHTLRIVTERSGGTTCDWLLLHAAEYSDQFGRGDMLTLGHRNLSGELVTVQVRITVPGPEFRDARS